MDSKTDRYSRPFAGPVLNRWNNFVGTPSGDAFAALLTIVVMFGAMFGCAFAIVLGMDGLQFLLGSH
jgi:hypothetical protein